MPINMDLLEMNSRKRLPKVIHLFTILLVLNSNQGKALTLAASSGKALNQSLAVEKTVQTRDSATAASSFRELGSGERTKRQLFRDQIPHHRPLSGNLYAHHHGYPHPGRWHANQQQIIPPNYNSGLHFDSPNVIITDDDFNRYGSTLQHIDDHRILTNPQPVYHQYPTEFAKVVPLDGGQGHDLPVPLQVPIVATHHHIHHGGGGGGDGSSEPYNGVGGHGHGVIHSFDEGPSGTYSHSGPTSAYSHGGPTGGSYVDGPSPYPPPPKSSKPFFGFKLHQLLTGGGGGGSKMGFQHPLLKGFLPGRGSGSGIYKRRQGSISWTAVKREN